MSILLPFHDDHGEGVSVRFQQKRSKVLTLARYTQEPSEEVPGEVET